MGARCTVSIRSVVTGGFRVTPRHAEMRGLRAPAPIIDRQERRRLKCPAAQASSFAVTVMPAKENLYNRSTDARLSGSGVQPESPGGD